MTDFPRTTCCEMMSIHLREETIFYSPIFREYGIPVHDGGTSFILIEYCPWCGKELPSSCRDRWFDILEELGVDSCDDENIPEAMKSDAWWKEPPK